VDLGICVRGIPRGGMVLFRGALLIIGYFGGTWWDNKDEFIPTSGNSSGVGGPGFFGFCSVRVCNMVMGERGGRGWVLKRFMGVV